MAFAIPFLAISLWFFVWLTFSAERRAEAAEGRRGALGRLVEPFTVADVNVPLLVVAGYIAWLLFRTCWRWADETALEATKQGLHFHKSLRRKPICWEEMEGVCFRRIKRGWLDVELIELIPVCGRPIRVGPVSNAAGAAELFAHTADRMAKEAPRATT